MKMELAAAAARLGESFYRIYLPVLLVDDLLLLHELLAELLLRRLVLTYPVDGRRDMLV